VARDKLDERLRFAVGMAGLAGRETSLVSTLAGGWKQRLALGAAILHQPAILFLDEPTSGVDPESRRRFWDLIHTLGSEGVSVLVSTHYMEEAEYCNRIALINRGRLIALDTPQELKQRSLNGELLAIECRDIGSAIGLLEKAPGVRDAAVFDSALHVLVDDAEKRSRELIDYLAAHDMAGATAHRIDPTIEDSFVALVGASSHATAGTDTGAKPS
jgi:ABC-2 type transport system ATP-binding protein